jgi:hypothetical protein
MHQFLAKQFEICFEIIRTLDLNHVTPLQKEGTRNIVEPGYNDIGLYDTSPITSDFFLCSEGPRSRCYGRTAALRLIVQPCDEDEDKGD